MAKTHKAVLALNRGMCSRLAVARVDLKRMAFSAETQINWVPRVLGSMMLRPGLEYIGTTFANALGKFLPFIFSTDDTALIEFTNGAVRIWINDEVLTRQSVTSTVANGGFTTTLASWTDNDEAGAVSQWATDGLELVGTGTNAAIRDQVVTVAGANVGVEHALRISVARGPVILRVGTAAGDDNYIAETELATGLHSLAFTPTGNFNIRFLSRLLRATLVRSCNVEAGTEVSITAPWLLADLFKIRADQSGDVLFVACQGYQQRKIERRAARSWSVVLYLANDGPLRVENVGPITIAPSALSGNITLTASAALFKATNVGGLYAITSSGQRVSSAISAQNTFTNTITVTGVGEQRRYAIEITGTWVATITVQRSVGVTGNWVDVTQFTGNASTTDNDGLDNQIVFYRIGIKTGDYVSGTATCVLSYTLGSINGVARITVFTSPTLVSAEVLTAFGDTVASSIWSEGSWSERRGWPSAVAFYEGRLWWSGKNGIWASVSDAFDKFDPTTEGDSGPINRTIGSGPVDDINWLLPMQRLLIGSEGSELAARSTTFDEPLTPTNFNIKPVSTQGAAAVVACRIDSRGIFVQRSGTRVYELAYSVEINDFVANDLTAIVPEVGEPSIVTMAVQRQPDTRIHCIRSDGTAALAVIDKAENVLSWQEVETDGLIKDVVVLPGTLEDRVYYHVDRTATYTAVTGIVGSTVDHFATQTSGNQLLGGVAYSALGAGYTLGDILTLSGGTFSRPARLKAQGVTGGGQVLQYALIDAGDYTAVPANPVSVTGGTGAGATVLAYWGTGSQTVITDESGSAWFVVPTISFIGGGSTGATATIALQVTSLSFATLGTGYVVGDLLSGTSGTASVHVQARVLAVNGVGGITAYGIVIPGSYSVAAISIVWTGGTGTGAIAGVIFGLGSGTITSGGSGYLAPPTVVVTGSPSTLGDAGSVTSVLAQAAVTTTATRRFLEKWALESECRGGALNKQADSFVSYSGVGTSVISGLGNLTGRDVVVWGDGTDFSPEVDGVQIVYRVTGGQIFLNQGVSNAVVGLPYEGRWMSGKPAFATDEGTAIAQQKRVSQIGFVLADFHIKGLKFGQDFVTMDMMPRVEFGVSLGDNTVIGAYDSGMIEFPGTWHPDARICMKANAPRPVTALALVLSLEVHDKG